MPLFIQVFWRAAIIIQDVAHNDCKIKKFLIGIIILLLVISIGSIGWNFYLIKNIYSCNNQLASIYLEGKIRGDLSLVSATMINDVILKKTLFTMIDV